MWGRPSFFGACPLLSNADDKKTIVCATCSRHPLDPNLLRCAGAQLDRLPANAQRERLIVIVGNRLDRGARENSEAVEVLEQLAVALEDADDARRLARSDFTVRLQSAPAAVLPTIALHLIAMGARLGGAEVF